MSGGALSVTSVFPDTPSGRPHVVLVHGAANSALVWTYWQQELAPPRRGWPSHAVDLRGHGRSARCDLSRTTMEDYADDVRGCIAQLGARPIVIGWSMGGLVALQVAARGDAAACVALAPSTPARDRNASIKLRAAEFGPDFYGITDLDPDAPQPAMPDLDREERAVALASLGPESRWARDDRKAGIVIETLPCPLLIVTGGADPLWPRAKFDGLWLAHDAFDVAGASHWGLVLSRRALGEIVPRVVAWLEEKTS